MIRHQFLLFRLLLASNLYFATCATLVDNDNHVQHQHHLQERQHEVPPSTTTTPSLSSLDVVLVKIGGSSITNKAIKESLDEDNLTWFSKTLSEIIAPTYLAPKPTTQSDDGETCGEIRDENETNQALQCSNLENSSIISNENDGAPTTFVIIHGAGSFGHFQAKEFGLRGPQTTKTTNTKTTTSATINTTTKNQHHHRYQMQGLAETRRSVQLLNHHVVSNLIANGGINAVGISPCFGIPNLLTDIHNNETTGALLPLEAVLLEALQAGLVPVLHGDACLYRKSNNNDDSSSSSDPAILSGDILMDILGQCMPWITRTVFITDVDGVYTKDPRVDPSSAQLLPEIPINRSSGELLLGEVNVAASASSHTHDVTGGLKTKLKSAAAIAQSGTNVTIVKCRSTSAKQALMGVNELEVGTRIYSL